MGQYIEAFGLRIIAAKMSRSAGNTAKAISRDNISPSTEGEIGASHRDVEIRTL